MDPVILKSRSVRHEDSTAARHAAAVARGNHPEVRLVALHGVVRAIEVKCSCGSTTVVELDVAVDGAPTDGGQS